MNYLHYTVALLEYVESVKKLRVFESVLTIFKWNFAYPIDIETSDSWLIVQNVSHQLIEEDFLGLILYQRSILVADVDVVADADEFLFFVLTAEYQRCYSDQILL